MGSMKFYIVSVLLTLSLLWGFSWWVVAGSAVFLVLGAAAERREGTL